MAKHTKANRKAKRSTADNSKVSTTSSVIRFEPLDSERPTLPEPRTAKSGSNAAAQLVSRPSLSSLWQQAGEPELIIFEPRVEKSIEQESVQSESEVSAQAEFAGLDPLADCVLEEGFFAERVDSIAPFADDIELEPPPFVAPPHVLVRREKMRRAVAWTLGFFAVVSIAVVANAMMPRRSSLEVSSNSVVKQSAPVNPTSPKEAAPIIEASNAVVPSQGETAALVAPSASTIAPVAAVVDPLKEALNLLNRGKLEAAISMADLAIERAPADATGYLYRGAAFQDLGRRKLAIEAYSDCVRNATKGPVQECRALGGKK